MRLELASKSHGRDVNFKRQARHGSTKLAALNVKEDRRFKQQRLTHAGIESGSILGIRSCAK